MGIPKGNTVAIAGDPGTGKTTFLLSFFRHGRIEGHELKFRTNSIALKTFDSLIKPRSLSITSEKDEDPECDEGEVLIDHINIFISLESSFERILDNNANLMPSCEQNTAASNGQKQAQQNDRNTLFIFIDATSLLSGRLEDRLRYPTVNQGGHDDDKGWKRYRFNLGGFDTAAQGNLHLCWQPDNDNPIRIEMIETDEEHSPFSRPTGGDCCRLYDLMTQTVLDPGQRIRLLKDLLAEMLSRFRKFSPQGRNLEVILTVDSLSALLANLHDPARQPSGADVRGQRLHILNFVRWLEESGITSIMACEAVRDEGQSLRRQPLFLGRQERYIASGVIQLDYHQYRSGDLMRYLRILKMRGAAHDMRAHAYDLGEEGISWIEPLFAEPETNGA